MVSYRPDGLVLFFGCCVCVCECDPGTRVSTRVSTRVWDWPEQAGVDLLEVEGAAGGAGGGAGRAAAGAGAGAGHAAAHLAAADIGH